MYTEYYILIKNLNINATIIMYLLKYTHLVQYLEPYIL